MLESKIHQAARAHDSLHAILGKHDVPSLLAGLVTHKDLASYSSKKELATMCSKLADLVNRASNIESSLS